MDKFVVRITYHDSINDKVVKQEIVEYSWDDVVVGIGMIENAEENGLKMLEMSITREKI